MANGGQFYWYFQYTGVTNYIDEYYIDGIGMPRYPHSGEVTVYSDGNIMGSGPLIGYTEVKVQNIDYLNNSNNGTLIKTFHCHDSSREPYRIQNIPNNTDFIGVQSGALRMAPVPTDDLGGALHLNNIVYFRYKVCSLK